jgi:hypothetical protein
MLRGKQRGDEAQRPFPSIFDTTNLRTSVITHYLFYQEAISVSQSQNQLAKIDCVNTLLRESVAIADALAIAGPHTLHQTTISTFGTMLDQRLHDLIDILPSLYRETEEPTS